TRGEPESRHIGTALQEDARRSGLELAEAALEVLAPILEIAVLGQAVGHQVVGGLVTLDAHGRGPEVHRQGEAAVDREDDQRRDPADPSPQLPILLDHTVALSVRNARSARLATSRRRGRDSRTRTS